MEIPYLFPHVKGIIWDYDSFLRKVYRNSWRTTEKCGLASIFETVSISDLQKNEKIDFEIIEISGGKCYSSKNDYVFNMRLKLVSGDYFLELKNAKNKQKNYSISFLNSFYVPILKSEGNKKFKKDLYYKYAICNYDDDIDQNNFDNKNGFVFQCHIRVYKEKIFKGQIQIKPFFDIVYITKNDTDGKIINDFIIVKFNIITSNNMNNPIQYEEKNMKSGYSKTNNKQDFLLLDSNLSIYICPDIPILTIKNYNEGIQLGGINPSGSKIILLLLGFLTNGYEYQKGVLKNLDKTKDEIQFNLEVIDNLEDKEKIKSIK